MDFVKTKPYWTIFSPYYMQHLVISQILSCKYFLSPIQFFKDFFYADSSKNHKPSSNPKGMTSFMDGHLSYYWFIKWISCASEIQTQKMLQIVYFWVTIEYFRRELHIQGPIVSVPKIDSNQTPNKHIKVCACLNPWDTRYNVTGS